MTAGRGPVPSEAAVPSMAKSIPHLSCIRTSRLTCPRRRGKSRPQAGHTVEHPALTPRPPQPPHPFACRRRRIIAAMTAFALADRMSRLGTESAFEVLARARAMEAAGAAIIHLEIGEPDFPTAAHIIEAAVEALRAGQTHYVPAPGIPPLREAVGGFLGRTRRQRGGW